jgi:ABC-2 type transport system permease protein
LHSIVELLPSYWLVQAGKTALVGGGWPAKGWLVIAVWTVVLTRLAFVAYRRSSIRA